RQRQVRGEVRGDRHGSGQLARLGVEVEAAGGPRRGDDLLAPEVADDVAGPGVEPPLAGNLHGGCPVRLRQGVQLRGRGRGAGCGGGGGGGGAGGGGGGEGG